MATIALCLALVALAGVILAEHVNPGRMFDFRVFWGAARLALGGDPVAAFDLARLAAAHGVTDGDWVPWLYAPGLRTREFIGCLLGVRRAWGPGR
jgi:hypothetical protein